MRAIGWRLTTTACLFAFAGAALSAIAQPTAPHPVPPPLCGAALPLLLWGDEFKPNYGDHVVGSELSKSRSAKSGRQGWTMASSRPERDDLNLPAGEPLYAYNPNIVKAVSDTPRNGPVIYDWYWCATPIHLVWFAFRGCLPAVSASAGAQPLG